MKKTFKALISLLIIVTLFTSVLCFNVSAANVTVSGGEFNVGQPVKIAIKFTADANVYAVEASVSYNSSVLRFDGVSGADHTVSNGTIKIVDDNFNVGGAKNSSYTLNFTAIAAGNSNIAVNIMGAGDAVSKASATAAVAVVTPKPSSNANFSSIKVSGASLSPAFKPNTTTYSATVDYSVENVNITGSLADGGATYVGGGAWALKVGNNSRILTVTAADGTKKSYTINIKRMSEEEMAAAEQEARDADPLLVVIDNVDYKILNDLSQIEIPSGFVAATATRKEKEIAVLNDEHGEYQLYYLVAAEDEKGAFYTRDENDIFTRVHCVSTNGKLFIIEQLDLNGIMPDGYAKSFRNIDGKEVEVYSFINPELKDFCIVKCYVDGKHEYFSFDSLEGTMQRATQFNVAVKEANTVPEEEPSKMAWFTNMDKTGKTVFFIIILIAIILVAVAVVLIVKISSSAKEEYIIDCGGVQPDMFVLSDEYDEPDESLEAAPIGESVETTTDNTDDEPAESEEVVETDNEEEITEEVTQPTEVEE